MYILVIEDDKFLADLIAQKLKQENIEAKIVVDGQEGLQSIEEKRPDLILLDLILPGMDGFELISALKKNPKTDKIPIIILSNLSDKENIERAMKLGARDFIIKADLGLSAIIDRIKNICRV